MTGWAIRNGGASSTGLTITGPAGDYSGLEVRVNNNSQYDITLGSGGAGTYDLTNITAPSGYTVKIRNNSVTNAVTVELSPSLTTSTSTAGGTLTISNPKTLSLTGLVSGSEVRVYQAGTTTELDGVESSGTTFSTNLNVSSVDVIIHALGYLYQKFDAVDMSAGDVSIPIQQVIDRQYENP